MKSLIAAALLCGVALPAHAADVDYSETCGSSVLLVGSYSKDRDVSVHAVYDHGYWRVLHTLSNGRVYDRGVQYAMSDTTTLGADGIYTSWTGQLNRNPAISMTGHLYMKGGEPRYREVMTKNGQTIMVSDALCSFDSPPTGGARPPVVASAPAYEPTTAFHVPVTFGRGGAYVAVSIGATAATMLVDTGATGMTVSASIADQLIASGQATGAQAETVILAGGVKQEFRQVDINAVIIAGHVVNNVHAGVVPDGSDMLLGLGVLAKVSNKFAINVANSTLDLD
ncbi:MAG: retropepsin-like aspartic protease [Roseiarcus sp.]